MVSQPEFVWIANHPALDFVNTELVEAGMRTDLLRDVQRLVRWLDGAGLLRGASAAQALAMARGRPHMLADALQLRAAMRSVIEQRIDGRRASQAALDVINRYLSLDPGHTLLASTSGGIERRFERELRDPAQLLQPIASGAAELLCEAEPALIKRCANHACILYFYDTSKNHARRWCSMDVCGNRTKVAAHYKRQRDTGNA